MQKKCVLLTILIISILLVAIPLITAKKDENKGEFKGKNEIKIKSAEGKEKKITIETREKDGKIKKRIKVEEDSEYEVETELEVEEEIENGIKKVKIKLKNGGKKELKVFPDEAALTAMDELGSEEIELKLTESSEGELEYEIKVEKEARVFGIFKAKMKIKGFINPDTGELIREKKAWWAFLASGEDDEQFSSKTTICHKGQTISVGTPAVQAHVRNHGDMEGPCSTTPPNTNNTNQTTPPVINNTNVTIPGNNTNTTIPANITPVNVELTVDDQGDKIVFTATPASEIFVYSSWDGALGTYIPTSGGDFQPNTWVLIENRDNTWEYVYKLPSCTTSECGTCDNTLGCGAGAASPSQISETNPITFEWDKIEYGIESETCSWGTTQCYNNNEAAGTFKIKFNYLVGCVQNTGSSLSQFPYVCPNAIELTVEQEFALP
jgi:major membrane immunogen (membrane-anchored lipoprotein)